MSRVIAAAVVVATLGSSSFAGFGVESSVNDNMGVWGETDLGYTYGVTRKKAGGVPDVNSASHTVSLVQSGVGITFYF